MKRFVRRFARSRSGVLGVAILVVVVAVAALAPVLFPGSPFRRVDRPFAPPFGRHLLGTTCWAATSPRASPTVRARR